MEHTMEAPPGGKIIRRQSMAKLIKKEMSLRAEGEAIQKNTGPPRREKPRLAIASILT